MQYRHAIVRIQLATETARQALADAHETLHALRNADAPSHYIDSTTDAIDALESAIIKLTIARPVFPTGDPK